MREDPEGIGWDDGLADSDESSQRGKRQWGDLTLRHILEPLFGSHDCEGEFRDLDRKHMAWDLDECGAVEEKSETGSPQESQGEKRCRCGCGQMGDGKRMD